MHRGQRPNPLKGCTYALGESSSMALVILFRAAFSSPVNSLFTGEPVILARLFQ